MRSLLFLCCIGVCFNFSDAHCAQSVPSQSFYCVRHGQTNANKYKIVQGNLPIPLNATGITQAQQAAQKLKNRDIKIIVSSPMLRTVQTANIIAEQLHVPIVIVDDLHERGAGPFEGKPFKLYKKAFANKTKNIGVEQNPEFDARVKNGLLQALKQQGPVLIVTHGGVYKSMRRILNFKEYDALKNAQIRYFKAPDSLQDHWQTEVI